MHTHTSSQFKRSHAFLRDTSPRLTRTLLGFVRQSTSLSPKNKNKKCVWRTSARTVCVQGHKFAFFCAFTQCRKHLAFPRLFVSPRRTDPTGSFYCLHSRRHLLLADNLVPVPDPCHLHSSWEPNSNKHKFPDTPAPAGPRNSNFPVFACNITCLFSKPIQFPVVYRHSNLLASACPTTQ